MITRVIIPQAFENMEEATIGVWLKSEGDAVREGEALCELITEKTTFELPAEGTGILRRITAPEKSIVPVGFILGVIAAAGEELPDIDADNAALRERATGEVLTAAATTPSLNVPSLNVPSLTVPSVAAPATNAASTGGSRVRATPAARRAAREHNVTIEDVAAAFPGKVLSEEDVAQFAGGK